MAENEDKLYRLIHSLDKTEKGFVKKYAMLHIKEDANSVRLFDIYNKVSPYDETKLNKFLSQEKFYSHLPKAKNYLYELILKSMRNYYMEKDEYFRLNTVLQNIHILKGKRLYKEAQSLIKKLKKECEDQERYLLLSETHSLERQMHPALYIDADNYFKEFNSWKKNDELFMNLHYGNRIFTELFYKVFYLIHQLEKKSRSEIANEINSIIQSNEFNKYHNLGGSKAKILGDHIIFYRDFIKEEKNSFHKKGKEILAHFDNDKTLYLFVDWTIIGFVNNIALAAIISYDEELYNDALDLINKLKLQLSAGGERLSSMANNCLNYLNCFYFLRRGMIPNGIQLCENYLKENNNHDDGLNENTATIYFYHSLFSFLKGEYSEAIKSLNAIELFTEQHTSIGLESESYLIKILCHYELNNSDTVDYLAKRYLIFIDKKTPQFHQRKSLIELLNTQPNMNSEKLATELLHSFAQKNTSTDCIVGVALLDLSVWCQHKITKENQIKLIEQKFKTLRNRV